MKIQKNVYKILTRCYDDNCAKKADFCIGQPEVVQPLGQLKDRVHKELGVAGNHGIDSVLPDDVSIKTNQALKQDNHMTFIKVGT